MPPRITDSQRQAVLALLAQGCDRQVIAVQAGVGIAWLNPVLKAVSPSTPFGRLILGRFGCRYE